jgi:hypothetical protein
MKLLLTILAFITLQANASVRLDTLPVGLSIEATRDFITTHKNVFAARNFSTGPKTLFLPNGCYIFMGGRTTVEWTGNVVSNGNNFIGNGNLKGTIISHRGTLSLNCLNISTPPGQTGVSVLGGRVIAQQCNSTTGKYAFYVYGFGVTHGDLQLYGGNYRSQTGAAILQEGNGHIHAYGVGFQMSAGADIIITGKSWRGAHIIEGCRTEPGGGEDGTMVNVNSPLTAANVILRANTYTSKATIVNYNSPGTLYMIGNSNYNKDEGYAFPSVIATAGKVVSVSNNYGNERDVSIFSTSGSFVSVGDMTRTATTTKPIEQVKTYPNVVFAKEITLPVVAKIAPIKLRDISNITKIGLPTIEDFGASVKNEDNSDAISKAINSNAIVLIPVGTYKVIKPVQITGKLGGGLWGADKRKSIIQSTSGLGCINVESAGYTMFWNFTLNNAITSTSPTFNFAWTKRDNQFKGSALQNTAFLNLTFRNGSEGLSIAKNSVAMGSELWIQGCLFEQNKNRYGMASSTNGYNALSDNYINCTFTGSEYGINFAKGCGNVFGCAFTNIGTAVYLGSQVGNGFLLSHSTANTNTDMFLRTANSSSRSSVVLDNVQMKDETTKLNAIWYSQGGTIILKASDFGKRIIKTMGKIGGKTLTIDKLSK